MRAVTLKDGEVTIDEHAGPRPRGGGGCSFAYAPPA